MRSWEFTNVDADYQSGNWSPARRRILACFEPDPAGIALAPWGSGSLRPHRMTRRVAILVCLLTGTLTVTSPSDSAPAPQAAEPRVIEVVARRYTFEPSQIDVTEGERIRLMVRSGDGPHGFEIERFEVSKELPRGAAPIAIEFTADEAGRFPILCSVFCGDGHEEMKGVLVVQAREEVQP